MNILYSNVKKIGDNSQYVEKIRNIGGNFALF